MGLGGISIQMVNELLEIARKCDRRNEWNEEEWTKTLTNCISKGQYILKIKNKEINAFACWLFVKEKKPNDKQFIEDSNGEIAYVQCAYSKEKGILVKMLKEGLSINCNKNFNRLYWYNEKKRRGKYFNIKNG